MKQKIILLAITLLFASTGSIFAEEIIYKNYVFTVEDGTAKIVGYKKSVSKLDIPSSFKHQGKTYRITSIEDQAFSGSDLVSITIPNSVTSIGYEAFARCYDLITVAIKGNITSIGDMAFVACYNLTSINIPNSVTYIGDAAFRGCNSLKSIKLPAGITSIRSQTFSGCNSLTSITIPNSVTSIGDWAFAECSSLTSITIPESVTSIGEGAFYKCESLTSVTIPNSVAFIGDRAFAECKNLKPAIPQRSFAGGYVNENNTPHSTIKSAIQNYYEVPYVGETSLLTEITGNEKNMLIEKYNFPTIINNFLDDYKPIAGKLFTLYREDIPNEKGITVLSTYRLMYKFSNGIINVGFTKNEKIERQSYGQAIYILNSTKRKAELFSHDIYFGNQFWSGIDTVSGVSGNNVYFKIINDNIISVMYKLTASTHYKEKNREEYSQVHNAIIYRNKIENIQEKTVLSKVEASWPLLDKNNPYRYTIQNAFDGNANTSFVENTKNNLIGINFDFTKDYIFTNISIINGYAQSENLYYANNQCKLISFPEISTKYDHLNTLAGNTLEHQVITFKNKITQSSANIDIKEIYKGKKYNDTCIAEINIKTDEYGWLFGGN